MIKINKNHPLKKINTFAIDATAKYFAEFHSLAQLRALLNEPEVDAENLFILGGGSNILFTQDYPGTILKNALPGIDIIQEDSKHVWLKVGAGIAWHQLVLFSVAHQFGGLENLSFIPGTVGGAPIQNIGAYGVELKDVLVELEAHHIKTQKSEIFNCADCEFGYRDSIFKHKVKGQYIILNITLRLHKCPILNISYGAIQQTIDSMHIDKLSIKVVSDAVIKIRQEKLPDPAVLPNAGSFFKNPLISQDTFASLQIQFPTLPHFNTAGADIKIPAAWLIEQCGWKGKRLGKAGVYPKQALVLANYDNASGADILALANHIQQDVAAKFRINLIPEVTLL